MPGRVLIVSPNLEFSTYLEQALEEASQSSVVESCDRYPKADEIRRIMGSDPPAAVVVSFTEPDGALSTLRRFRRASQGVALLAVHNSAEAGMAREASRAGADAFFAPPFDLEKLRFMAFAGTPVKGEEQPPAKVLAFVPARGGDGASTLALHVAHALSAQGGAGEVTPTLLVDMDFHAGASAFRLKLGHGPSVLDALRLGPNLEERWRGLPRRWRGMDVLVAPDMELNPPADLFQGLSDFIALVRRNYRYAVLDMPPALYASSRDLLRLSDLAFVVYTPEVVSRAHADRRSGEILNLGLQPKRVAGVLNRADSKTPRTVEGVFMGHGLAQFATVRNDYAALQDAERGGRLAGPETRLGEDVRGLTEKIVAEL